MLTATARAPFLDVQSFLREEGEAPPAPQPGPAAWSPFVSAYAAEWEDPNDGRLRETYAAVASELYDEEFDEALFELLAGARGLHQEHLASGYSQADADRIVTEHFAQLTHESERMLDALAERFGPRAVAPIDDELDQFAEGYAPAAALQPEFEEFLGRLVRKVGRGIGSVARRAATGVAAIGLGPILNRIKALVRPLLNQVLLKAIGRLPHDVQPAARRLAQRLGFDAAPPVPAAAPPPPPAPQPVTAAAADSDASAAMPAPAPAPAPVPALAAGAAADGAPSATPPATNAPAASPDSAGSPVQPAAGAEVSEMQLEFDALLAEAMLAEDDVQFELEMTRTRAASNVAASPPVFAELDHARERLMDGLAHLKEGESAAPHLESFLPAVLPALRIATRLIGRPRVVSFLAGLLGKLIANLVGPGHAPALSRALVDAGLKLVSLEAPEDEVGRLATSAIAATVEETLVRVASLPDRVLDDEELLEGFALEAFEQAAAANLPAVFPGATYRRRPDLLEGGVNAAWVMQPLRRPRYKRCSQTFNVTITPQMAEAVETFEDTPLSDFLQDQLGVADGEDVRAELHLFEVLAGGTAADIARSETGTPGLGAADEVTLSQLHPLTHEAASVLLGRPGFGRRLAPASGIRALAPGQRVYHMVLDRRPVTIPAPHGRRRVRRPVRVNVMLDVPGNRIRVGVFVSEVKAQRLAVRLRQQAHAGSLAVAFQRLLARRLPPILHGRRPRRLRIVHPAVAPGGAGTALERLPAAVPRIFIAKLQEWLTGAFGAFAKTQAGAFLAASEHPADGVTLMFTIERAPGLAEVGQLIVQRSAAAAAVADRIANSPPPSIRVEALPGYVA